MATVQVEVLGELLLLRRRQPEAYFDWYLTDAEPRGDAQPVSAVDDVARLVDDDRHDDGLARRDVLAQRRKLAVVQRRQQIGVWQAEDGVAYDDS
jgi:hypothetical protein